MLSLDPGLLQDFYSSASINIITVHYFPGKEALTTRRINKILKSYSILNEYRQHQISQCAFISFATWLFYGWLLLARLEWILRLPQPTSIIVINPRWYFLTPCSSMQNYPPPNCLSLAIFTAPYVTLYKAAIHPSIHHHQHQPDCLPNTSKQPRSQSVILLHRPLISPIT